MKIELNYLYWINFYHNFLNLCSVWKKKIQRQAALYQVVEYIFDMVENKVN